MEETSEKKSAYGKRPLWQWIALYAVIAVVVYGVFYYFVLNKNGGYNTQDSTYSDTPSSVSSPTPEAMSYEMNVSLATQNNSGEEGMATLKEENGKVTVTLSLTGFTKDIVQPAHIHIGACPGVGEVKYPLTNVVNGESITVLDITLADLKQNLPLAINVHKSAKEVSVYTACGELPSQ